VTKLIVSEFVSLNGVMDAPGGEPTHPHTGWTFESIHGEDRYHYKLQKLEEAGSSLRMFPDPDDTKKLKLKDARSYDSGVALLVYERAED
jgi:hypothetical protein